ncbi:transaldolase family protein [Maridesulfovibrio sp. FT414]|uniref:transaldolase family protein n=1 Tax=Maridesulfovibrio sp. FT414 TaxID=2979469 RepID=UPI003D80069F
MKIYLKSCSLFEVKKSLDYRLIDGVYLVSEKEAEPCIAPDSDMSAIIQSMHGPVFLRAMGESAEDILEDTRELMKSGPNIVIRIKANLEGFKACSHLAERDIMVAVDGIETLAQGVLAAKSGAQYIIFSTPVLRTRDKFDSMTMEKCAKLTRDISPNCQLVAGNISDEDLLNMAIRHGSGALELSYRQLLKMTDPAR